MSPRSCVDEQSSGWLRRAFKCAKARGFYQLLSGIAIQRICGISGFSNLDVIGGASNRLRYANEAQHHRLQVAKR